MFFELESLVSVMLIAFLVMVDYNMQVLDYICLISLFLLFQVEIKGIVLLSVNLSREVVPGFARILLSLGKKHIVRPLLRAEITQVVNRRAWYDATKLNSEVLNLYKVKLLF